MSKSIDKFQEVIKMIDEEIAKESDISYDYIREKADLYFNMYLPNEMKSFFEERSRSIHYSPMVYTGGTSGREFDKVAKNGLLKLKRLLKDVIEYLEDINRDEAVKVEKETINKESNKVFIVHGHNNEMKNEVARFVEKLGLKSIILSEMPDKGRTIISKFQEESKDIRYAIVLLSEDDQLENGESRTRQNVIFELGYFIGKLSNSNVVLLKDGNPEIPSDLYGVIYENYESGSAGWKLKIASEMKNAGIMVDLNDAL